jgi:hypothetical protein
MLLLEHHTDCGQTVRGQRSTAGSGGPRQAALTTEYERDGDVWSGGLKRADSGFLEGDARGGRLEITVHTELELISIWG